MENIELKNRLNKNLKKRVSWLKSENTCAFRLYDRDIPGYPFIIDIYNDYALIWEKGKRDVEEGKRLESHQHIKEALVDLGIEEEKQIIKIRMGQKNSDQYDRLAQKREKIVTEEGGVSILINLYDYIDTGLFLDHRPMRKKLRKTSKDKTLLNLFAYTCSISLFAALGGAKTCSVDKSSKYLDWGKENYKLNDLDIDDHEFISSNVLAFLKEDKRKFDIIFLDPPTFSNEKKKNLIFEIEKDHIELINLTMSKLEKGGILYFSNNKRSFKLDPSLMDKYLIYNITKKTIPFDYSDEKIHHCFEIRSKNE